MAELILGEPNDKQRLFLLDRHKFIGFGGARGGGKSWVVRSKAILLALNFAGIKIMVIRRTYPELLENHIMPICEALNCYDSVKSNRLASYNDSKKCVTFPNGSRILFRYCENDKDAERFQGIEVDVLFIDEATHQSEERMKKLTACVRGVNDFPKRVYYTFNPGGEGHAWAKRLFIDRKYNGAEKAEDYTFIQSLVTDNDALMHSDPEYVNTLKALPPKLRDAWLYGKWDVFEGQFFEEFTDDPEHYDDGKYTHVINPLPLSKIREMNIYRGYDWGFAKPFSCSWYGIDREGIMYKILELYGCESDSPNVGLKWNNDQQFDKIHKIEMQHPYLAGKNIIGIADPSIWDASRGESTADMADKHQVFFTPGDNHRISGWMQCHYRLSFDDNGYPLFYVFNTCKQFIRTIPLLMYSNTNPEDLDTAGEDHQADEWRYVCMARPIAPRKAIQSQQIADDPLNMIADAKKRTKYTVFSHI